MAIKKLQNNYTTPEQSKRLLELGVPAGSADMLWDGCVYPTDGWEFEDFPTYSDKPFSYYQSLYRQEDVVHILPCWSVGRLMEIYVIARGVDTSYFQIERGEDMVICLIRLYKEKVKDLDFSKLEE